jgi:hypothetical protein
MQHLSTMPCVSVKHDLEVGHLQDMFQQFSRAKTASLIGRIETVWPQPSTLVPDTITCVLNNDEHLSLSSGESTLRRSRHVELREPFHELKNAVEPGVWKDRPSLSSTIFLLTAQIDEGVTEGVR